MKKLKPIIAVCGLEGASKSTSIKTINEAFSQARVPVARARMPGGTPMAEELRTLHKKEWTEDIYAETELLMMMASFHQLVGNVLVPEYESGNALVLDRFWWCNYAYQIHQRMPETLFKTLIADIEKKISPTHILFLDVEPEVGIARARGRGQLDRLEKSDISFFHRARQGYLELAKRSKICTIINANQAEHEVQQDVLTFTQKVLSE
jgi:dTMP kinase